MNKTLLLGMRHRLRALIDKYPKVYLILCKLRLKNRPLAVSKNTELVIEGYPRSANTFAVAAFTFAQGRPVKIARHLHAPAQVIAAVKKSIPTIVLIRRPRDAVLSLLVRAPHISAEQALKDYIRFYRTIIPFRKGYVIAKFEEVTSDFGQVIRQLNARFRTNFKPFEHTKENLKKVFQIVEEMNKQYTGLHKVKEEAVGRPSPYRETLKRMAEPKLETPKTRKLLMEAESVYYMLIKGSQSSVKG